MVTSAYRQFLTNEPESFIEFRTIEIWHPALSQVYRFVNSNQNIDFTLENSAPRNPSQEVTFVAATMDIIEPGERQDAEQLLEITFGNTDDTIYEIVDQIQGQNYLTEAEIIYRKYYSGDTLEPATTPLYLFASVLNFTGIEAVSFTAEDTDLTNKKVGEIYTVELFPGLLVDN